MLTESSSLYNDLDQMKTIEILRNINQEDQKVAHAVALTIPMIEKLVEAIVPRLQNGGRIFYIGAGTSGRLGVVDASECPPTFGVSDQLVVGIIAGGDRAIRKAVEGAEDNPAQAWNDLLAHQINLNDTLIGIAASGRTPYVIGGLQKAKEHGILTASISCNAQTAMSSIADFAIEALVGPEFLTGSTRMKAGTAQKLILNMISTSCMIRIGRVKGNKMVDMQLSNEKLIQRGTKMVMDELGLDAERSKALLLQHGSVRAVLQQMQQQNQ